MKLLSYSITFFLILAGWLLFNSNSTGSPGGKSGSPGDGSLKCTQCHVGTASNMQNWITHDIPLSGYTPGSTYTITATGTHNGVVKFGFELTAENASNVKTGTFSLINTVQTKFTNNNNAVTHTSQGTAPSGNSKTWSMKWTAPASFAGNITFYAAFNAANGNGATNGDKIYLSNTVVPPNINAGISIPATTGCPDSEILIPINVSNFYSIGAITLFIEYDTAVLVFNALTNINSQFPGMIANAMNSPVPRVGISWSSLTPATLVSGKLADLSFSYRNNTSNLVFSSDCEIVNNNLGMVSVNFSSGNISPMIGVNQQPQNISVYAPNQAGFTCMVSGATQYQWKESSNGGLNYFNLTEGEVYSGVNSNSLLIKNTNTSMNNYYYKCLVSNGTCSIETMHAVLSVLPPLSNHAIQIPAGWSGISSYIDPLTDNLNELFQPLGNNLVILQNLDGAYYPEGNVYTVNTWNSFSGFYIKLENPETLTLQGYPLIPRTINLNTGWNLIPVLSQCDVNTALLFAFTAFKINVITEVAGTGIYWPDLGINNLPVLYSGKSYLIKAKQNFSITFPNCP